LDLKPNYGYYALPKLVILWILIGAIGLAVLVFLNALVGLIIVGFDIYMAAAYAVSLALSHPHRSTDLPKILKLKGDEDVLDVGCGLGKMTVAVAKHLTSGRVTGIDIWDQMEIPGNSPQRAYKNATIETVAERVKFEEGNVLNLDYPDASFDIVTSSSVLNNLEGRDLRIKALREAQRVLRPGGALLLLEPLRNLKNFFLFTPFGFPSLWDRDKWISALEEVGFRSTRFAYEKGMGIFLALKLSE
jgi:ubiquinone/menaquinone biosynthesis C-methylase UbiE